MAEANTEAALRAQLAATYRVFAMLGWDELIYNHISARVPGELDTFLINPFGLHYSEVTPDNLVKVGLDGRPRGNSPYTTNPAGFVIHSAIHGAVPEAHCVMHVHTTAGMAVACTQEGLQCTNFYAAQLRDRVSFHDFEGITLRADEGERLVSNLAGRPLLILRNHGLLSVGSTIAQAFANLWTLNRACEVQVATAALGQTPLAIPDEIAAAASRDALQFDPALGGGQDVLDALIRLESRDRQTRRAA
ncbi:class II aldolase/adducin family protein [Roseateles sp. P5_E11]